MPLKFVLLQTSDLPAVFGQRCHNDALGNRYAAVQRSQDGFKYTQEPDTTANRYERCTGRMRVTLGPETTDTSTYDRAGNRTFVLRQQTTTTPYDRVCGNNTCASSVEATLFDETVQFYGAEGRLRIADRRTCLRFNNTPNQCDTSRP